MVSVRLKRLRRARNGIARKHLALGYLSNNRSNTMSDYQFPPCLSPSLNVFVGSSSRLVRLDPLFASQGLLTPITVWPSRRSEMLNRRRCAMRYPYLLPLRRTHFVSHWPRSSTRAGSEKPPPVLSEMSSSSRLSRHRLRSIALPSSFLITLLPLSKRTLVHFWAFLSASRSAATTRALILPWAIPATSTSLPLPTLSLCKCYLMLGPPCT